MSTTPTKLPQPLTLALVANAIYKALNDDIPTGQVVAMLDGEEITYIEVPHDNDDPYPDPDETTWIELSAGGKVVTVRKVIRTNNDTIWLEADNELQVFITFRPRSNRLPLTAVITPFPSGSHPHSCG